MRRGVPATAAFLAVCLPGALGLALVSTLPAAAASSMNAPDVVVAPTGKAAEIAKEVCEEMVSSAVEEASELTLAAPPAGVWVATNRFTCTYDLGGGTIVLGVRVLKSNGKAKTAFEQAKAKAKKPERLNGLGQSAFQASNGTLVARKDQFLLTIDPLALPEGVKKADVALAASVAVLACWTGEA